MILLGTIVNAGAILLGTLLGVLLPNLNAKIQQTVMQALSLSVIALGLQMAFKADNFLIVIISIVVGGIIGEWLQLDEWLQRLGKWIEHKVNRKTGLLNSSPIAETNGSKKSVATAFVTTTLVYCIGAMAVLGAMDSGLRNDHTVLYTKSLLDGFSAIIFSSTLGYGVAFSAVVVFVYQGAIAIASSYIIELIGEDLVGIIINAITGTGGLLIAAIGFNVMELTKIRVANLLPGLLVAAVLVVVVRWF